LLYLPSEIDSVGRIALIVPVILVSVLLILFSSSWC
jgi:hypothetical protein